MIERLTQLRDELGLDGIVAELNPGGRIPPELETRSLQILTHDVLPALVRKDMSMVRPLILSSDSHVFEPPDLWTTRIDAAFRDRAPRMQRIDGADQIVIEADQVLSGIGLISNAGARFEAPETISGAGALRGRASRAATTPTQHLRDMGLDGVAGEVLYPSQGLFYFRVTDSALMSAIFRAYNDWLAEFCRTDPARLKGIAMINLDDVQDGDQGAGAGRAPGARRRHDHRVSARAPALRPARVRAVLGGRRRRSTCRSACTPRPGGRARSAAPATRRCATRAAARRRRSIRRSRCAT